MYKKPSECDTLPVELPDFIQRVRGGEVADTLRDKGFKELAWTRTFRSLWINHDLDLIVRETEGDIQIKKGIGKTISYLNDYKKAHITGTGERYDDRFPNRQPKHV